MTSLTAGDFERIRTWKRPPRVGEVDGGSFALDEPAAITPVWGSRGGVLWAEGEPTMLYGPDGVGKTTVAHQLLCRRIGIGEPELFGMPVAVSRGKTLYLALDRPKQAARSLRRMVTEADRGLLSDCLIVWRGPVPFDLTRDPEALVRFSLEWEARTVVVDSLKDLASKLSDEDTGTALHRAWQSCVEHEVEVLVLHHPRKAQADNKKPTTLADVYGSRWITAGMGSVILLWGDAGDPIVTLEHLKQPGDAVGPLRLLHDNYAGTTTVVNAADVVEIVRGGSGQMTARQVAVVMFERPKPTANQIEKARRRLNAAVKAGQLGEEIIAVIGGEGTGYVVV